MNLRAAIFALGLCASATVSAAAPYMTGFEFTENPISDSRAWHHQARAWASVRTLGGPGVAIGTETGTGGYDDSYAILSGFSPDQGAAGQIYKSDDGNFSCSKEMEILLRMSDTSTTVRGYEVLFSLSSTSIQFIRWNGALGDFTVLPGGTTLPLSSGDTISATIVGSKIEASVNGNVVATTTDSTFKDGNPGMGFFRRECGGNTDMAFTSFAAWNIP
jgi:hypothetical protein